MYKEFNFPLYDDLWKSSSNLLPENPVIALTIKTYCLSQLHDNQNNLSQIEKQIYLTMIYEMKNLKIQYPRINSKCMLREYEDYLKKQLTFLEYMNMKGNKTNELSQMYLSLSKQYEPLNLFNGFNDNNKKLQCYCYCISTDIASKLNKERNNSVLKRRSAPQSKNEIKGDKNPFAYNNNCNSTHRNSNTNTNNTSYSNSNVTSNLNCYSHSNSNANGDGVNTMQSNDLLSRRFTLNRTNSQLKLQDNHLTSRISSDNLMPKQYDQNIFKLDNNETQNKLPFVLKRTKTNHEPVNIFSETPNTDEPKYYYSPVEQKDESIFESIVLPDLSTEMSIISHSIIPSFCSPPSLNNQKSFDIGYKQVQDILSPEKTKEFMDIKSSNSNAIRHLEKGFLGLSIQMIKNSLSALRDIQKEK